MKLLNCLDCNDVIALAHKSRSCFCGKSEGFTDARHFAQVKGNARILGMRNDEYVKSIQSKDTTENYRWFVIQPV